MIIVSHKLQQKLSQVKTNLQVRSYDQSFPPLRNLDLWQPAEMPM